jgi:hypothetical protein
VIDSSSACISHPFCLFWARFEAKALAFSRSSGSIATCDAQCQCPQQPITVARSRLPPHDDAIKGQRSRAMVARYERNRLEASSWKGQNRKAMRIKRVACSALEPGLEKEGKETAVHPVVHQHSSPSLAASSVAYISWSPGPNGLRRVENPGLVPTSSLRLRLAGAFSTYATKNGTTPDPGPRAFSSAIHTA